jgi:hypothetical protein
MASNLLTYTDKMAISAYYIKINAFFPDFGSLDIDFVNFSYKKQKLGYLDYFFLDLPEKGFNIIC